MLTERHYQGSFHWPKGYRTAVVMTFDDELFKLGGDAIAIAKAS